MQILRFTISAVFIATCPMLVPGIVAFERKLQLPDSPYNYADTNLPSHVEAVAATHDDIPADNPITNHGATLGRVLFYDRTLSVNESTSCASCHKQKLAFSDGRKVSVGFAGEVGNRNSMSLVNARYYRNGRFFWDERAATLEKQVLMPIENEVEMGHSFERLIPQLRRDPIYPPLFRSAFGSSKVTKDRIAKSLAQFIRSITSFQSKYDAGRQQVSAVEDPFPNFTEQENYGKDQFLHRGGCAVCHMHSAPSLNSNGDPQKTQSAFFFIDRATVNGIDGGVKGLDPGVGGSSNKSEDVGAFKAPSLRNIELTAPYMHDGRFGTLDRVIEHYNWSVSPHPNLDPRLKEAAANGIALPEREKLALTAFLRTLTDHRLTTDPKYSDPFVRE